MKKVSLTLLVIILSSLHCKKEPAGPLNSYDRGEILFQLEKKSGDRDAAMNFHKQALAEHKKKNYKEAEKLWYQAAKADPAWSKAYFNLACSTALQGSDTLPIEYLKITLKLKPGYLKKVLSDPDLESLREEEGSPYWSLVQEYGAKIPPERVQKWQEITKAEEAEASEEAAQWQESIEEERKNCKENSRTFNAQFDRYDSEDGGTYYFTNSSDDTKITLFNWLGKSGIENRFENSENLIFHKDNFDEALKKEVKGAKYEITIKREFLEVVEYSYYCINFATVVKK